MIILLIVLIVFIGISISINKKESFSNYSVKNYQDLLNDFNNGFDHTIGGIPKIVIKTSWQSKDKFPQQIIDVLDINKKLNPDWDIYYFNDNVFCIPICSIY